MQQTSISRALTVERCAVLPVGDGQALLHVTGRWDPAAPADVELLSGGSRSVSAAVAPGPRADSAGLWSASFAIDSDAADAPLLLIAEADGPWRLPRPELQSPPGAGAPQEVERLRKRCEVTERALSELREKLVKAWSEAGELRELLAEREETHRLAAERESAAAAIVAEVEARLEGNEHELAERRAEMASECARLQQALDAREREGAQEAGALRAQAAEALAGFEQARAEGDTLRARLADARALADETLTAAAAAARELAAQRARAEESSRLAEELRERLTGAEHELQEAHERIAALESRVAEAEGRAEAAAAESAALAAQVEEAQAALNTRLAEANAALEAAESRAGAATEATAAADGRAHAATAEAAILRERLVTAERASAEAAAGVAELSTERDRLAGQLEELSGATAVREGGKRRSKVAARVYREALQKLEIERARAEATEAKLATAREELDEARRELDAMPQPDAEPAAPTAAEWPRDDEVEADLRHLLAMRQRELDELRTSLNEQRARYAALASQLTPQELAQTAEQPAAQPWTAIDGDLLDRLTRAKELTAED